jgi:hypothetical protein
MKTAVMTFGRFQPVTKDHYRIFHQVMVEANERCGTPFIFTSATYDPKNNPLDIYEKYDMLMKVTPHDMRIVPIKDPLQALHFLAGEFFRTVIIVAGSDRLPKYKDFIKYTLPDTPSDKRIHLDNIILLSAGERTEDGVSASKARQLAKDGNLVGFTEMLPGSLSAENVAEIYTSVRRGLGIP